MVYKICTHISRARRKEKKSKERGHHHVPEIGGQVDKCPIERGWIRGKARKRVRQFSRDWECPMLRRGIGTPLIYWHDWSGADLLDAMYLFLLHLAKLQIFRKVLIFRYFNCSILVL